MVSHGTVWPTPSVQECSHVCAAYSSANMSSPRKNASAACHPMAQSAVSRTVSACRRIKSSVSGSASHASTCESSASMYGIPSRQGVHLPHVWHPLDRNSESCKARGHIPGGVASMRLTNSSTTPFIIKFAGVFGPNVSLSTLFSSHLFIFLLEHSARRRIARPSPTEERGGCLRTLPHLLFANRRKTLPRKANTLAELLREHPPVAFAISGTQRYSPRARHPSLDAVPLHRQ